jgi:predicted ferric reductase
LSLPTDTPLEPNPGRPLLMTNQIWWNLTRASANIAMVLILLTVFWGVLLATRVLKPNDRPAWLRDIHTWMGGLALIFTIIHMLTLIADSYISFTFVSVLVPFVSKWKPLPVSAGILGFYILAAVQITSLMMRKMSRSTWRRIHLLSYVQFVLVMAHTLTAGSDVGKAWYAGITVAISMVGAAICGIRLIFGKFSPAAARAKAEQ